MALAEIQYQPTLRTIGEYLDQRPAHNAGLIQVTDGFVVQYQRKPDDPMRVAKPFTRLDLDAFRADLQFTRPRSRNGHPISGWYADVLRSFGYELDQRRNDNLLIDEQDDGFMITYVHFHPRGNYIPEKYLYFAGRSELETILLDAYDRRRPDYHTGNLLKHPVPPPRVERPRPALPPELLWDVGERVEYQGEVAGVTFKDEDHGQGDCLVTNRRVLLRTADGAVHPGSLAKAKEVAVEKRRNMLSPIFTRHRVAFRSADGHQLVTIDCRSGQQAAEIQTAVEGVLQHSLN